MQAALQCRLSLGHPSGLVTFAGVLGACDAQHELQHFLLVEAQHWLEAAVGQTSWAPPAMQGLRVQCMLTHHCRQGPSGMTLAHS